MVQMGKYMFGNVIDNGLVYDKEFGIYDNDVSLETPVMKMNREQAVELTRLMMSFLGISAANELSDKELLNELKDRGYHGKLNLDIEI